MNIERLRNASKQNGKRIWILKAKVLRYVAKHGSVKATDLDRALLFSAWRRANDLKKDGLLEVPKVEKCKNIGERFYYTLSPLGRAIISQAEK